MKLIDKDVESICWASEHVIMFKFIPKDIVKLSYATKYHEKFSTIMRLHSNMIDYRIVMCKNAIFVQ